MKTPWLIGIVAAAHVVAIGSAILIQGCGTPEGPGAGPAVTPTPTPGPVAGPNGKEKDSRGRTPAWPKGPAAKASTAEATTYVVQGGDTLSSIARRFNTTVSEILTLNGITNPNKLKVGQKLLLPGKVDVSAPRPAAKPAPATGAAAATPPAGVLEKGVAVPEPEAPHAAAVSRPAPAAAKVPAPAAAKTPAATPAKAPGAVAAPATPAGVPARTEFYTVKEGDTLRDIAMNRALSVSRLREVNNLPEGAEVKPGQVLKLPPPD
jgi:peptidoglycan endopeptidase LytF